MKSWWLTFCCVWALLVPGRATAFLPGPLSHHLPWERVAAAKAGTWTEYVLVSEGGERGPWLRFLSLGPGPMGGHWVEIWISQRPGSGSQAFRLLVKGDPGDPKGLLRVFARLLGGPVQEIPMEELQLGDPGSPGAGDGSRRGAPVGARVPGVVSAPGGVAGPKAAGGWGLAPGNETAVQTEAGTFRAQVVEAGAGDELVRSWFSPAVPLFGLVRLSLPTGVNLELYAMGEAGVPMIDLPESDALTTGAPATSTKLPATQEVRR